MSIHLNYESALLRFMFQNENILIQENRNLSCSIKTVFSLQIDGNFRYFLVTNKQYLIFKFYNLAIQDLESNNS